MNHIMVACWSAHWLRLMRLPLDFRPDRLRSFRMKIASAIFASSTLFMFGTAIAASTCPFDTGGSDAINDGVVLTRYALGITGAPMTASTRYASLDPLQVKANIECVGCALDMNGDGIIDTVDATIIARHLAGFQGASLTAGLALGVGTRNTTAAVASFLEIGCNMTGGTITSITAGTGLSGGTITSSGTLAADTAYLQRRLASTCGAGSFITGVAADGTVTCAAPTTGGSGTVTNVGTGAGLTGGPITATGTLSADTAYLQRRLASTCGAGSFITGVAADGTVTCAAPTTGGSGTVTNVGTGAGLTGGPITATGTLAADTDYLQRRVASNCAVGSAIRSVAVDGTVTCEAIGAANAFVQGGNAFGAPGVLGTLDAQPLTVKSGGTDIQLVNQRGDGLRVSYASFTPNTINGITNNTVSAGVVGATIGGGGQVFFTNRVTGDNGTVAGGYGNRAYSEAVVSGGQYNSADGFASVVSGGTGNPATGSYSTVAGGQNNTASGLASVVSGGNSNAATGSYSTVAGGRANTASGLESVVAGGSVNRATGIYSTVAGGQNNTASVDASVVSGGIGNAATGNFSTVAGGFGNVASGDTSFAAGQTAYADKDGTFVWADQSSFLPFKVTLNWVQPTFGANTFNVRAAGGVMFATSVNASGAPATFCYMGNSGTGWICSSDRNVKERVEPITPSRVLAGVLAMPVSTWSIIGSKVRQMGPMAQDFYRAFGLGDTDKAINSIDVGGVAFAAIQGLNETLVAKLKSKDTEIANLKARLAAIEKKLGM